MFSAETYRERRSTLAGSLEGVIVLLGNRESPINYVDNPYPFRQDSSFLYYFGLSRPDLAAIIDCDRGEATLFGDDPSLDDIIWTGPQPPLAERAERVGVDQTAGRAAIGDAIAAARGADRPIHCLPAYRGSGVVESARLLGLQLDEIREAVSLPLLRAVIDQRSVKTGEEIAEIERAVELSAAMQRGALTAARPGVREQELVARAEAVALEAGGRTAFPTILTVRGETLHNHDHGNLLEAGDLLLVDCGAEVGSGYSGDLSRTAPVGGRFDDRQRALYEIALDAHDEAARALAPGVPFRDVHRAACRRLASGLADLGLLRGDLDEAVDRGAHALFFQCGTGHMMGLDVHDMENLGEDLVGYDEQVERSAQFGLRSLRLGRAVREGFVVTVEPGLYFIPQLIDRWSAEQRLAEFIDYAEVERYRDFGGLRTEDDYLVTADGCRRLGPPLAREADEIEALIPQI